MTDTVKASLDFTAKKDARGHFTGNPDASERHFQQPSEDRCYSGYSRARSRLMGATHPLADCCDNIMPTTVPTTYMAQAERLNWVLVELNMKYSPRSAIPEAASHRHFWPEIAHTDFLSYADRELTNVRFRQTVQQPYSTVHRTSYTDGLYVWPGPSPLAVKPPRLRADRHLPHALCCQLARQAALPHQRHRKPVEKFRGGGRPRARGHGNLKDTI